jgi:hypothetical protein
MHILAQTISLLSETDVDPYAVLGVLIEGVAHTIARHIPTERQAETAWTLPHLLRERPSAHGLQGGDQ